MLQESDGVEASALDHMSSMGPFLAETMSFLVLFESRQGHRSSTPSLRCSPFLAPEQGSSVYPLSSQLTDFLGLRAALSNAASSDVTETSRRTATIQCALGNPPSRNTSPRATRRTCPGLRSHSTHLGLLETFCFPSLFLLENITADTFLPQYQTGHRRHLRISLYSRWHICTALVEHRTPRLHIKRSKMERSKMAARYPQFPQDLLTDEKVCHRSSHGS